MFFFRLRTRTRLLITLPIVAVPFYTIRRNDPLIIHGNPSTLSPTISEALHASPDLFSHTFRPSLAMSSGQGSTLHQAACTALSRKLWPKLQGIRKEEVKLLDGGTVLIEWSAPPPAKVPKEEKEE